MKKAIVISASSDIGAALCKKWKSLGWDIAGTYRTASPIVDDLQQNHKIRMVHCDLLNKESVQKTCSDLKILSSKWDVLVLAPGTMDPIGNFESIAFDQWEKNIEANFLSPLRILHSLLPIRGANPSVLFFAGAGTNNAALNYSAYAISKVSLIKMCELLDNEIPDTRFVIIGPGWVKTKIHESTLKAGIENAGANYYRTLKQIAEENWISMDKVVECCTWAATSQSKGISGRNFSVAHDAWGTKELEEALEEDHDMYKLRRNKNQWKN